MAFNLTLKTIQDQNIRHIYSGPGTPRSGSQVEEVGSRRRAEEYPNMDQLRLSRENQALRQYVLSLDTCEYNRRYDCLLPRAPAFRVLSRHQVDKIVERLMRPTVGHTPQDQCQKISKVLPTPQPDIMKHVSREEMAEIMKRVCKPTQMSIIRERTPLCLAGMPEIA